MNHFATNYLYYMFALCTVTFVEARQKFNAVIEFTAHSKQLYSQEWNQEEPSALDPATADATIRRQICDDISRSGMFLAYGMEPVSMEEVYDELQQFKYSDIFHRIYSPLESSNSRHSHTYMNPYTLQEFELTRPLPGLLFSYEYKEEYTFICLLRKIQHINSNDGNVQRHVNEEDLDKMNLNEIQSGSMAGESTCINEELNEMLERNLGDLVPFYVTKAYGVKSGLHVHHFLLLDAVTRKFDDKELMVVDLSAEAYVKPDFNVELHYLELRKYHKPASTFTDDPVLKFYFYNILHVNLNRVCTIVASSTYFQEKFGRVTWVYYTALLTANISFRTEEGTQQANGKLYQELVMKCTALMTNGSPEEFYLSRAYNPFQVFLYLVGQPDDTLVLEILATNVPMVQDYHNFGDVEI